MTRRRGSHRRFSEDTPPHFFFQNWHLFSILRGEPPLCPLMANFKGVLGGLSKHAKIAPSLHPLEHSWTCLSQLFFQKYLFLRNLHAVYSWSTSMLSNPAGRVLSKRPVFPHPKIVLAEDTETKTYDLY